MIVCDCCKKPTAQGLTRMVLSWAEGGKKATYELCEVCRNSLLNCMDKGPIWEYIVRCDKEHAELVTERNGLRAALDEVVVRYKQLKEENSRLKEAKE